MSHNKSFRNVFIVKQKELSNNMGFHVDMQDIIEMMIQRFETELREPESMII